MKILPSKTFVFTEIKYFLSKIVSFVVRFFCIIESSIWVPKDLGSVATETPVPNKPLDPVPTQLMLNNNNNNNNFFLFFIF